MMGDPPSCSFLFQIFLVFATVPCKWIQPTGDDWRNVWQALKFAVRKREYKLNQVFEATSKTVMLLFYVLHFAFTLALFLRDLQHLAFSIVCLVVSFIGFVKNTAELICLWRKRCRRAVAIQPSAELAENHDNSIEAGRNGGVERQHDVNGLQSSSTGRSKELLKNALEENLVVYPAIVCSIVRFVHGKVYDFNNGWSDYSTMSLLCCGIAIDIVFFKIKRVILVYRYWTALCNDYQRLNPNNCCSRIFGVLPRFVFHLLTMPICQWLHLLILGYQLRFEHKTLHLNFAFTWRSAYLISAGIFLPFCSAVVFFLLNQAWIIGVAMEIIAQDFGQAFVSGTMASIANTSCFKKFYGGFWQIQSGIILIIWCFACQLYFTCVYSLFPFDKYAFLVTFYNSHVALFLLALVACYCISNIHALVAASILQIMINILVVYVFLAFMIWIMCLFSWFCTTFCVGVILAMCGCDEED